MSNVAKLKVETSKISIIIRSKKTKNDHLYITFFKLPSTDWFIRMVSNPKDRCVTLKVCTKKYNQRQRQHKIASTSQRLALWSIFQNRLPQIKFEGEINNFRSKFSKQTSQRSWILEIWVLFALKTLEKLNKYVTLPRRFLSQLSAVESN